ncbi:hypothetical protein [Pseudonocardia sp. WMMC193]|uniref:hypothetical protein n=1 Tax=Pseudonocardia sp. WMMC193 TaxID=2911965 RepID=UPI001F43E3CD|nr:hypothetical protein [Pseudonocardia sp. WMMC193]MCF7548509.1 hypothetical protein [Pseudonocardia sp. WMMC193]
MITTTTIVCRRAAVSGGLLDLEMAGPAELQLGVRGGLLTFAVAVVVDLAPDDLGTTPEIRISVGAVHDGGKGMDRVKLTAFELAAEGEGDQFVTILGDAKDVAVSPELGPLGGFRFFAAFNFVDQTLPAGNYAFATEANGALSSMAPFRIVD